MSTKKISFKERALRVVARIPRGKTMTYKEVARRAGSPRAYRAVGNIMNRNQDTKKVPCHRVVRSDGNPGGYAHGRRRKILLLRREGVRMAEGRFPLYSFIDRSRERLEFARKSFP